MHRVRAMELRRVRRGVRGRGGRRRHRGSHRDEWWRGGGGGVGGGGTVSMHTTITRLYSSCFFSFTATCKP